MMQFDPVFFLYMEPGYFRTLGLLFFEFFKTGLFAVGGGLSTIPFLNDMAQRYPWFTTEQLADMIAVGESTPGPIGVNCATYAGYNAAGVAGALTATFALVLPSYIIICIISGMLEKYRQNPLVDAGFKALRPAATGLIAAAGYSVFLTAVFAGSLLNGPDWKALLLFALLLLLTNLPRLKKLHPLAFIGAAAVAGICLQM